MSNDGSLVAADQNVNIFYTYFVWSYMWYGESTVISLRAFCAFLSQSDETETMELG
jgi:hypothetical protein